MYDHKIAIIGLGYVGLPLAIEFGKQYETIGYDINEKRILQLKSGIDHTYEVQEKDFRESKFLSFTNSFDSLSKANIFIITVPTPVDTDKKPDLSAMLKASEAVGKILKVNDIVIYESTVYPGATEEECAPILEKVSGLQLNKDFFCGYSPERINPGDKQHRLSTVVKVTSGSTPKAAEIIDRLYSSIVEAGTYKASSIKVAEAAKVIENTQRDVNIALVNEFALIFNKLGIDTNEILEAAATKWNFLNFKPGLVGGHCIGVDPFYLTHKAQQVGHHPEVILAGRKLNDGMGTYIATQLVKLMRKKNIILETSSILILGLAFKENCPDIRNSKVVDIVNELNDFGANVACFDPWVDIESSENEYKLTIVNEDQLGKYDAVLIAVAHDYFKDMKVSGVKKLCKPNSVVFDLKSIFSSSETDGRL